MPCLIIFTVLLRGLHYRALFYITVETQGGCFLPMKAANKAKTLLVLKLNGKIEHSLYMW